MLDAAGYVLWQAKFPSTSAIVMPLGQALNWLTASNQTGDVVISVANEFAWINLQWKRSLSEAIGSILYSEAVGRKGVFLDGIKTSLTVPGPGWTVNSSAFGNRLYYII